MTSDYIGVYLEINPGTKIKPKFPATLGLVVNGRLYGDCDYVQYIGKGKFALLYPNGRVRKDIVPDVVDYEEIKLDARKVVESVRLFFSMEKAEINFRDGFAYFKTALLKESIKTNCVLHCGNGNFVCKNKYHVEVPE